MWLIQHLHRFSDDNRGFQFSTFHQLITVSHHANDLMRSFFAHVPSGQVNRC